MTKIRLQANKVKHVLSANQEIPIHMDALYDDMNLSMKVSRTQFEELCDDLTKRATDPIIHALAAANVTLEEVTAIELLGGGMRVPKVQSSLTTVLGDKKLGMHINSDESMALGAAFYGANISTAFRVRQVGLVDINPFAVGISLDNLETGDDKETSDEGDDEVWAKKATIFKANGKIGVKKTIAFTHDQDVHCALDYSDPEKLPEGAKKELQRYKISGISDFAKEMEEKGLGKPKVSLQFELSNSGTTLLVKAEAAVEEKYTVEVEVEIEDDEDTEESSNETSTSDDEKETKTEETASDEDKKNKTEETAAEGESNQTTTEDESKSGESSTDKKEEPKKKKTKLVEKVR